MQIAIVGLARSGKTTVFNTLTRGTAETGGFGGLTVNTGVVKVPDERLSRLTSVFRPKREVPADVTYVDLPAPAMAAEGAPHADIPADQLARLRNADALLHVVRAFADDTVPHPLLSVDPQRDVEQLELEFTLADLGVVEKRVEKLRTSGRHGTPAEREANDRELEVLERILPALTEGRPIRDLELSTDEELRIRGFRFLTEKPVLVLLNVGEADLARADALAGDVRDGHPPRPDQRRATQRPDRDGDRPARRGGGAGLPRRPRPDGLQPGARHPRQLLAPWAHQLLHGRPG